MTHHQLKNPTASLLSLLLFKKCDSGRTYMTMVVNHQPLIFTEVPVALSFVLRTKTFLCFSTDDFFDSTKSPHLWSKPLLRMIHQCITPENKGQDRSHEEQLHSTNPKESAFPSHLWYRACCQTRPQIGQKWERWIVGRLPHLLAGNLFLYFKELIYKTGKRRKREKRTGCLRCTSYLQKLGTMYHD